MNEYLCLLKGISPVLWNIANPELVDEYEKLKKEEIEEWNSKSWRKRAEYDEKGNLVFPSRWLHSALIKTCMDTRMIPHWSTTKSSTFTSYIKDLNIYESKSKIYKKKDLTLLKIMLDAQPGNFRSDTKVWRYLPKLNEWDTKYRIVDLKGKMYLKELKSLIEYSGCYMGLGDLRFLKYGRFELIKIDKIKNKI